MEMKTIKGTTTFDVTVEIEWEVRVPIGVDVESVRDALGSVTSLDDLEEQVSEYVASDYEGEDANYDDVYMATGVTIHQRIDDVCGSYTDITDEGEEGE